MQNEGNVEGEINVRVKCEIEIILKTDRERVLTSVTYTLVGRACRTKVMLRVNLM